MYKAIVSFLLITGIATMCLKAQYRGGIHEGFNSFQSIGLNPLPNIYGGGLSDGFEALVNTGLNELPEIARGGTNDGFSAIEVTGLNELPQISSGGANDGFHSITVVGLNSLPEIYSGGADDGFDMLVAEALNLLPGIYAGGANDGYDIVERTNNNLPCSGDLFVWTGEVNEDWHESGNWECRVAPGLYSQVIIPEGIAAAGRPYPVVYLEAEVSTISLRSGAYLQIEPGVIMRLNGN
jgi:hypothetical protein